MIKPLTVERYTPYGVGLLAVALWFYFDVSIPFEKADSLLSSSLTLGAIMAGFLATAQAIVMTLDSPVMQRVRETDHIEDLVSYLTHAIFFAILFSVVCLAGYFFCPSGIVYGLVWISTAAISLSAFARISFIIMKIIKYPDEDEGDTG